MIEYIKIEGYKSIKAMEITYKDLIEIKMKISLYNASL